MSRLPRGAAIKLLANDLLLMKKRADQLRLGVISKLIAIALLSLSSTPAPGDDVIKQNDNDPISSRDSDS